MRTTVLVAICLFALGSSISFANDMERVITRVNLEATKASDAIEGTMYKAARILKQQRILLEQEMDGMSGSDVWVNHEKIDGHIQILTRELHRAANEYLPPICAASAKLSVLAKKGRLKEVMAQKKAPSELQHAIDHLLYMEESMAMWHHYVKEIQRGSKGLSGSFHLSSIIDSISRAIDALYGESQMLVSVTFPALIQGLIAARDLCSLEKADLAFLDQDGTGCANCSGHGCGNCMLAPGEHHEIFDFGCGEECGH